jgi:hypothetical protein
VPARASRRPEIGSADDAGSGERPRHRPQESAIDTFGRRPEPVGHIIGRRRAGFEQMNEKCSPDVDIAVGFEQSVRLILAALPFLLSSFAVVSRGAHDRTPFGVLIGGLHPQAMKDSISAMSQRRRAESL